MKSKIFPLAEDASFRKFYRLTSNRKSKIIVIAEKEKYKNLIAYTAINKFLRKNNIFTPKLFSHNFRKGIIVIEDFGDLTFYSFLIKKKEKLSVYKKIIDLLIKIQRIKPKTKIQNFLKNSHVLDKYNMKYLLKESDLFFDWYLPLFIKKGKVSNIKAKTKKILTELYNRLNFPNSYFVHRDYHVQNLMKVENKIGVIDSQDALIGNPTYDLASLIDDVRIKTSKKLKNQMYNYYLKKTTKLHKINSVKFLEDFNILSVQRNLKIIGIFSRLYKRDKKAKYLKLIPYAWKLLEGRMDSTIFFKLKKVLDNNIRNNIRKKIIN